MNITKLLLLSLFISVSVGATAEIYRWTDDKGVVHFGDKPKKGVEHEKLNYDQGLEAEGADGETNNRPEPMTAEEMEKLADELKESRLQRELAREKRKAELERQRHEKECADKRETAGRLKYEVDKAHENSIRGTPEVKERTIDAKTYNKKSQLKKLQEDIKENCL